MSDSGAQSSSPGGVMPRLATARKMLEAKDLPAAVAIYEEVLDASGDRADVLVTISGDLGTTGNIAQIIELIAPRYDADRHGPATGLNLLQAYLAIGDAGSAQHVLDILFSLNRPELEERLFGFSNAIADLMASAAPMAATVGGGAAPEPLTTTLLTISKPIWSYGLDAMIDDLIPPKVDRPRRIAFAQLFVPGAYSDPLGAMKLPEDDLARLARGIPLWLTEMFYFSAQYSPLFATGLVDGVREDGKTYCVFPSDWVATNIQKIVAECDGALDYIYSGSLRHDAGDFELVLRLFEVKKFRERKSFTIRWNPASADDELNKLHDQVRAFMEWSNAPTGLQYQRPARPLQWARTLAVSLSAFLADKALLPAAAVGELQRVGDPGFAGSYAGRGNALHLSELEAFAWLTFADRAKRLGISAPELPELPDTALVRKARELVGFEAG